MIAGHITSSQDFYRAMADVYREGFANSTSDGELPEVVDNFAKIVFEDVVDDIDKAIADDDRAFEESGTKTARWILTRSIYLTNAFYTVPGQDSIPREFVCVKLSQVVGWTFGVTSSQ